MPRPVMDEAFQDMLFPVHGVDLSRAFSDQAPATTLDGTNVRAFEPGTGRARGGSRPGLQRYVTDQIPEGAVKIQHLTAVVLNDDSALLGQDPSGGGGSTDPNDPINNPVIVLIDDPSDPGDPLSYGDEIEEDPVTHVRTKTPRSPRSRVPNNPRQKVRKGGSMIHRPHNSWKKKPAAKWKFIQARTIGFDEPSLTGSLTFNSNVTVGNLLVVAVALFSNAHPSSPFSISDDHGNTYTFAKYKRNNDAEVALYYAVANASGSTTVTAAWLLNEFAAISILEYKGNLGAPLDSTSNNGSNAAVTALSTGAVAVNVPKELVIGAFSQGFGSTPSFTQGAGLNLRTSQPDDITAQALWVADKLEVDAALDVTGTLSVASPYAAVGASFKPL